MFLTVITRTFRRPTMLAVNQASLARQTRQIFHHMIIPDEIGIGCAKATALLRDIEIDSEYVWVLDDDNYVADDCFVQKLEIICNEWKKWLQTKPDMFIINVRIANLTFPQCWPPKKGFIDMMNFVVSKDIWYKHRNDWLEDYAGDFDFIDAVVKDNPLIYFHNEYSAQTQRISKGAPE